MEKRTYPIYIASSVMDGGIYQYLFSEDGSLEFVNFTQMDRPMYMIKDKHEIDILLREPFQGESGVVTYSIDDQGILREPTEIYSTRGKGACHLTKSGGKIYCVNYWSGSVVCMPNMIKEHNNGEYVAHPHFVGNTPDEKYLMVSDLGLDKIFVYDKELEVKSVLNLPSGYGPRHLICHENERIIYCANELHSSVSVLEYEDGMLSLKDTISTVPSDFRGNNAVAAIRFNKNKVFVSNRGHDSIAIFDFSGKSLTFEKTVSVYGCGPRDFIETENNFICANQISDTVTVVSKKTGRLLAEISIKEPMCICT